MRFSAEQAKDANYACAAFTLVILLARVAGSRRRQRPIDLSFFLVVLSILVVVARIIVVYYYLLYGTGSDALRDAEYFNTHNLDQIKKGSILSLVARVLITTSCWLQWVSWMIKLTWAATGASFVAVVLVTLLECRPLRLYWQVEPDPGSCVKSYAQLLLQCAANIVLDLMLLAISYPILVHCKGRDWKQHLRVGTLFVFGTFCIIVTSLRLASIYDASSAQPTRSLWASIQMLTSTFVANAPTIYGDLQTAKRKKSEAVARRTSLPEVWRRDSEAGCPDLPLPERAATHSSIQSRKEWFDHLEDIDDVR
ncbi:hypothetical protein LTR70_000653 [Exophiala xenobiotica]|uniref:Rhodopsin domain-containing protein n=1 Tax=Lithohypha guttulata TaxID=1690604 RepID=A0ABR0KIJ0_9EURO|nr:hypothetical protein LTR24_002100 [Lithohypha guttulata]KAK5329504.1 hypothetical protein LTR70_000653 [Exophiala xenobiotica]